MSKSYMEEYQRWLDSPALSEEEWKELNSIAGDEKEIENRFYAPLEFGTAGLRGTMKLGLHNMNIHIIRHATQAFANVILADGEDAKSRGIVIAHDCRLNGVEFSKEAACVMAANGIHVRFFDALRPTPELSFAVLHYGTAAGLNITASHNPKEYNGYKVYWSDGAQLPPHKAEAIAKQMEAIDIFTGFKTCDFDEAVAEGKIEIIGQETDELFLENVMTQAIDKEVVKEVADDLRIVYTPFHGTGLVPVTEALDKAGYKNVYVVEEQAQPDPEFSTVKSPNPEEKEGFQFAIKLAEKVGADVICGTDPDADRIGVLVKDANGEEIYKFESTVVGGAIPKEYIPAVGEGIEEAMKAGILGGFPVVGVHANVYDGSYHEVDSSEMAFHIAGSLAFKEAMQKGAPVLLEPIMKVEVSTPEDYMGDVIGDINSRRGRIEGMDDIGGGKMIRGFVPLAEMFGYATDLRSKTQGRGNYSMFFDKYEQVPKNVQEKVLSAKAK